MSAVNPDHWAGCDCSQCLFDVATAPYKTESSAERDAPTIGDVMTAAASPAQEATPPRAWSGIWNNWIAPFHACPRCGASLNWKQGEDALERPLITASHCGVYFSAPMAWRAE